MLSLIQFNLYEQGLVFYGTIKYKNYLQASNSKFSFKKDPFYGIRQGKIV